MTRIATLEGNTLTDLWDWASSNAQGAAGTAVSDASTYAKAKASALVIATMTGVQPSVLANPDGSYTVSFQGSQREAAIAGMNKTIAAMRTNKSTDAEPKIKYDLSNVMAPVIFRQALPYIALATIVGGVGYAVYKSSKRRTA